VADMKRAGILTGASPNEVQGLTEWLKSLERNVEHGDTLAGDEARALAQTISVAPIPRTCSKADGADMKKVADPPAKAYMHRRHAQ
jgi:hypothetical protein